MAALQNEKDHKAFLASALGSKTPKQLKFKIPASVTKTGQSLLNTRVALGTAFVQAYLGAVGPLSSKGLKIIAAKVAANEASHFSFFDHGQEAQAIPGLAANGVEPGGLEAAQRLKRERGRNPWRSPGFPPSLLRRTRCARP